jgi:hypothetical protein
MTTKNKVLVYVPIGFLLIAVAVAVFLRAFYLIIREGASSIPRLWPFLLLVILLLWLAKTLIRAANRAGKL